MADDDKPDDTAAWGAYREQCAEIIAGTPRASTYKPAVAMSLRLANRRQVRTIEDAYAHERPQLNVFFDASKTLTTEHDAEVVDVLDADSGELRYRLYGWGNMHGAMFLPEGVDVVAYGCQHDIEHWNLQQRDLFFAMDAALRANGHGFRTPLSFCWWDEDCWTEIVDTVPGTVHSEPWVRQKIIASMS